MEEIREIIWDSGEYREELVLRDRLLRRPLGLCLYHEDLTAEGGELHFGAFQDGLLAGVLLLVPLSPNQVRMRQVAVREDCQGIGLGRRLVSFAEAFCHTQGIREIRLNARKSAEGFYHKLGYETISREFTEVTIPHVRMQKRLDTEVPVVDKCVCQELRRSHQKTLRRTSRYDNI